MKRILLADDHSLIRRGLSLIIKDEYPDVQIQEVADGDALVEEAAKNEYDLLITDVKMPGRSGFEGLKQIKHTKPNLPVLILSSFPEDMFAIKALLAGASGYLNKNSAPDELINVIHRIEQGKKYISAKTAEHLINFSIQRKAQHETLTPKEFKVFRLLAQGKKSGYISQTLSIALSSVSAYRNSIFQKLGVGNMSGLVSYAMAHQIEADTNP